MNVVRGLRNAAIEPRGRAVAIGVFDGVHWGHQAIFHCLVETASSASIPSACLTFKTHPAELLAPNRAPLYINTLDQRIEVILTTGVDEVITADFTPAIADTPREDFMKDILVETLGANRLVVGSNFRFGRDREGDIRYLTSEGPRFGIEVQAVPAVVIDGAPVSSTRIRALVARGDIESAAKLLGRRFTLRGTVVAGRRIGRTMGFPTANLDTAPRQLKPARGVYAVEVVLDKIAYRGVCNIGQRPTFSGDQETIEVHLGGFEGDIYGRSLDVSFVRRLRNEMVFENAETLAQQIRLDLEQAADI